MPNKINSGDRMTVMVNKFFQNIRQARFDDAI